MSEVKYTGPLGPVGPIGPVSIAETALDRFRKMTRAGPDISDDEIYAFCEAVLATRAKAEAEAAE